MREALNNNPMVQIAVIAVMVLLAGVLFMTRMKSSSDSGGESSASSTPAATAPGAAGSPTGNVTGDSAAGPTGASAAAGATSAPPTASASAAPSAGTVQPEALVPGPGLPQSFIVSWARGDAIVLLIVRNGGIDDKLVRASVSSLRHPGVKVFVVRAGEIARYSRITQGVGVNRVPALVVVRPRTGGATVPEAQVSYGFRSAQGVVQAVSDALYKGPDDRPYDPG